MKPDRKTYLLASFMLMFLGLSCFSKAEKPEKLNGLSVQLISDHSTITAGQPFLLGFHIQHQKGYHTYWKNPGLVGLATQLEWKLPRGYKVSEVNWPYPIVSSMAGNPCYGYERDVTLYVTVTPPEEITSKKIAISVNAIWMCCADSCYPGSKTLRIDLPVGQQVKVNTAHQSLIALAKKQTPLPNPAIKTKLLSLTSDQFIRVQVAAPLPKSPKEIYLFSEDGQISSAHKQTIETQTDGTMIITTQRSEFTPKKVTNLPAVIKLGDHYYTIKTDYEK